MTSILKQRGITMWGMMFVIVVLGSALILFVKLYPPHYQNYKVKTALKNLAQQRDTLEKERNEIKASLDRRFQVDDVDQVKLDKQLFIDKSAGGMVLRIEYEVAVPILEGYSVLITFKNVEKVGAR